MRGIDLSPESGWNSLQIPDRRRKMIRLGDGIGMKKTKSGNVDPSLGTDDTLGRDTKLIRPGKRAPIFLPEETQEKREIPMMEALHANGVLVSDDFREENPCLLSGIQLSTVNTRGREEDRSPSGGQPPCPDRVDQRPGEGQGPRDRV